MPKPDAFIRSLQQQMETMMLSDGKFDLMKYF